MNQVFPSNYVYHSDSDFMTASTNLFSITGGVNLPVLQKMTSNSSPKWEPAMVNGGIIDGSGGLNPDMK